MIHVICKQTSLPGSKGNDNFCEDSAHGSHLFEYRLITEKDVVRGGHGNVSPNAIREKHG